MRQGPNGRRPRGRHHNGSNGGGNGGGNGNGSGSAGGGNRPRSVASLRHQSFDSNCGDLRVRGNAWQVCEKYQGLARDATSAGDRVGAENYLQHAEHYHRIIAAIEEATMAEQRQRGALYDSQPPAPANYYAPDGSSAPHSVAMPQSNGNVMPAPQQQPAQTEATVQTRNVPSTPFFTQEEIDEHNGNHSALAAAR